MTILIAPYSTALPDGKENPKNYPFWNELTLLLKEEGHTLVQLGAGEKDLEHIDTYLFKPSMKEVEHWIKKADIFICVDTWLQHAAHYFGKKGIVLFSVSDPKYFGYSENINILKDAKYLRRNQFGKWSDDDAKFNKEAFVAPEVVMLKLKT